jgi:Tfp pilus assembly protein PilV
LGYRVSRNRTALSLVETVIAIFLLAAQILLISGMVAQFNRGQRSHRLRHRATALGQEKMDEIRAWAGKPANYLSGWTPYKNQSFGPIEDTFRIETDCNPTGQPLFSPCLGLEAQYGARAKRMKRSVVPVKVSVIWDPASAAGRVELFSLVGEPARSGATLSIAPDTAFTEPVAANADFGFKATVVDANNVPIEDIQYQWRVKPVAPLPTDAPGNASLLASPTRSMESARARHVFRRYGLEVQVSGKVELECRALYHGQVLKASGGPVQLQ